MDSPDQQLQESFSMPGAEILLEIITLLAKGFVNHVSLKNQHFVWMILCNALLFFISVYCELDCFLLPIATGLDYSFSQNS